MTTSTTPETAYLALQRAAEQIGRAEYAAQVKRARGRKLRRFTPSPAHRELVAAMPAVLAGTLSVDHAMALLHWGETDEALHRARVAE